MRKAAVISVGLIAWVSCAAGADDALDRVEEALAFSALHDQIRAKISGALDLEEYYYQSPPPGLFHSDDDPLFNPRLTLFLDAQLGSHVYLFVQSRTDHGFDPGDGKAQTRLDEYAVRFTPGTTGVFNLQVGKFATVVGNWVARHDSWDNPFITAPLPYENLTGIFDGVAAGSPASLLSWANLGQPVPPPADEYFAKSRVPVVWGPSYTSGLAVSGTFGRLDYAVELKNAALSSRPRVWDAAQTQWQYPTLSGRVGWRPDESWNFGLSFSSGSYLMASAAPTLAPGRSLGDYREVVIAQDLGYAWHHFQFWAESYETSFEIPGVGNAQTLAYYLEAKYKFTAQFFGAVRWNQQLFGTIPDGQGGNVRWGRDTWRIDLAPGYRFTPHTELKLQYSLQHGGLSDRAYTEMLATQIVIRF